MVVRCGDGATIRVEPVHDLCVVFDRYGPRQFHPANWRAPLCECRHDQTTFPSVYRAGPELYCANTLIAIIFSDTALPGIASGIRRIRRFRSMWNKSRQAVCSPQENASWPLCAVVGGALLVIPAWGADDPGARALQQHQLQRQQQQDALQLRMQQQQNSVQGAPVDSRQIQAVEQLQINQRLEQQQLHYRQGIEPVADQPSDDHATRGAKRQMELDKAQQQGRQQLRRFESQLQEKPRVSTDQPQRIE